MTNDVEQSSCDILIDFKIKDKGFVSSYVLSLGFTKFLSLAHHIRDLPYGRVVQSDSVISVIKEHRGTCSSKHLLLATLSSEAERDDIQLMVGIYQMSEKNTPGIGTVLQESGLSFIPEAHCYLKVGDIRYDFTGLKEGETSPFESLLYEKCVLPYDLYKIKERLHRTEIIKFALQLNLNSQRVWNVREACIRNLSARSTD